jgi:hypothetical protein
VGVGGEGDRPVAKIYANRAGLLELRGQIDRALAADKGMAAEGRYRETDEVGIRPVGDAGHEQEADGRA